MTNALILVEPFDRKLNQYVPIRLAYQQNSAIARADGHKWHNAVTEAPKYAMTLTDENFSSSIASISGDLSVNLSKLEGTDNLLWEKAKIKIWIGSGKTTDELTHIFTGIVRGGVPNRESSVLTISFESNTEFVDQRINTLEFSGQGGLDGDPDQLGQLRPAGFGEPFNIEVQFFDIVNNVAQIDGYGNLIEIFGLYEDLGNFGPSVGNFPNYDALVDADIPPGRWGTCLSDGLIRLGAPPQGVITCDARFGGDRISTFMQIILARAGVADERIRFDEILAMENQVEQLCGEIVKLGYWSNAQENSLELLERICSNCNALLILHPDETIGVSRILGGSEQLSFDRNNNLGDRVDIVSRDPIYPVYKIATTSERNFRVHSTSDIDYESDIEIVGGFDLTETYRLGHVVITDDGAQWLFINEIPQTGDDAPLPILPATQNSNWSLYVAPVSLTQLGYVGDLDATRNDGALADFNSVTLGGPFVVGTLPVAKAVPELINTNITVNGAGVISGIGTANISVDNRLNDRIINLVAVGTGKVEGNSVSKTGGFGQNGGAFSLEASTSFYVSAFYDFATLTGSVDFGLSDEATPDGTDRDDFLCHIAINGSNDFIDLFVDNVGFARFTAASGALPSSGVLTIFYEGQKCSFFVNGILLRERLSQDVNIIVRALIMPTSGGVASKLDNISYGPANNTLWDAISESENRPADRATSNIQLERFGPRASDVIVVGNSMSINANSLSSGVYTSVCRQKTALFQVTYNGFRGGFIGLYDTSDYDFPASQGNFGRIGLNIGAPNANGQVSCGLFYREEGPTVFAGFFSRIFNVGDQLGFICDGTHYHFTVNGAINYSIRAVNNNELKSYIIINGQPSSGQFPFIDIDWLPYTDNALASLGGLGLAEENIRNPIINADGTLEVVKGDGSRTNLPGQVTLGGIGAGALASKNDVNLAGSFVNGILPTTKAADGLKNSVLIPSITSAAQTAQYGNVSGAPQSLGDLDSVANTKLGGIEIGADVTSNQQIIVSPPTPQIIYRNFDGTPKTNQFPLTLTPQITKGGQDIRTSNEVSYAISANGVTATINNTNDSTNKGRITVTGGGAGNIQLIITVNNAALPTYSIPFTVQDDPPPQSTGPTGSTSGSDSSLAAVNSNNSDVQMTGTNSGESIFLINLSAGQRLIATAPLIYQNFDPSPTRMIATWQYRLSGSTTWIDFGGRLNGTQSSVQNFGENEIRGQINVNQNRSGLAAGPLEVRLVGRTDISGRSLTHISGTATVRAGT